MNQKKRLQRVKFIIIPVILYCVLGMLLANDNNRIRPYGKNPYYCQYRGEPLLLIGGSGEDNLFNHPINLAAHLDKLAACGDNYIRNTMSSRDPFNIWAFKELGNGMYDLNQWNEKYWQRFETLLQLAADRNIIIQIEIWDPFWRNVFGGCASTRFHREGPSSHHFGIGLSELAQTQIRSMLMLTDAMRVFTCLPHNDLLNNRADNEAYCLSEPGWQYAVYFRDGGEVSLSVSEANVPLILRWLDVENCYRAGAAA